MLHVLLFFILHDYYITSRVGFVTGVIHLGLHCTLLMVVWKVVSRPPSLWDYLYKDCSQGVMFSQFLCVLISVITHPTYMHSGFTATLCVWIVGMPFLKPATVITYRISSTNSILSEKCAKSAISGVIQCDRAAIILLLNIVWHIADIFSVLLCILEAVAFSALALLVGHQEERLACKKYMMSCWHGYLPGARCKWFAYCPAYPDVNATPSSLLASLKSRSI